MTYYRRILLSRSSSCRRRPHRWTPHRWTTTTTMIPQPTTTTLGRTPWSLGFVHQPQGRPIRLAIQTLSTTTTGDKTSTLVQDNQNHNHDDKDQKAAAATTATTPTTSVPPLNLAVDPWSSCSSQRPTLPSSSSSSLPSSMPSFSSNPSASSSTSSASSSSFWQASTLQDRLSETPVGEVTIPQWSAAQTLLQSWIYHKPPSSHHYTTIHCTMIRLLDRMAMELEHHSNHNTATTTTTSRTLLTSVDPQLLEAMVLDWRNQLLSSSSSSSSTTMPLASGTTPLSPLSSSSTLSSTQLLSPVELWQRVQRYWHVGLVQPTAPHCNHVAALLLNAWKQQQQQQQQKSQTPEPFSSSSPSTTTTVEPLWTPPEWAHQNIYQYLHQPPAPPSFSSSGAATTTKNPNSTPTRSVPVHAAVVQELLELWWNHHAASAAAGSSSTSTTNAAAVAGRLYEYWHALQQDYTWATTTNPETAAVLRPTASMYCLVLEALCGGRHQYAAAAAHSGSTTQHSTQPQDTAVRSHQIQTLLRDMRQTCPPRELDARIHARLCQVLAQLPPHLATMTLTKPTTTTKSLAAAATTRTPSTLDELQSEYDSAMKFHSPTSTSAAFRDDEDDDDTSNGANARHRSTTLSYEHVGDAARNMLEDLCHRHYKACKNRFVTNPPRPNAHTLDPHDDSHPHQHVHDNRNSVVRFLRYQPTPQMVAWIWIAHARAGRPDAVMELYEAMKEWTTITQDPTLLPNRLAYAMALTWAYAQEGNESRAKTIVQNVIVNSYYRPHFYMNPLDPQDNDTSQEWLQRLPEGSEDDDDDDDTLQLEEGTAAAGATTLLDDGTNKHLREAVEEEYDEEDDDDDEEEEEEEFDDGMFFDNDDDEEDEDYGTKGAGEDDEDDDDDEDEDDILTRYNVADWYIPDRDHDHPHRGNRTDGLALRSSYSSSAPPAWQAVLSAWETAANVDNPNNPHQTFVRRYYRVWVNRLLSFMEEEQRPEDFEVGQDEIDMYGSGKHKKMLRQKNRRDLLNNSQTPTPPERQRRMMVHSMPGINFVLQRVAPMASIDEAQRAQTMVHWLERQHQFPHLKPTRDTYLHALTAWCTAKNPSLAETALEEFCDHVVEQRELQQEEGKEGKDTKWQTGNSSRIQNRSHYNGDSKKTDSLPLDQRHVNLVMESWMHQKFPRAGEKAARVMTQLERLDLKPNANTYNTLLWALAKSNETSFRELPSSKKMLRRWEKPDKVWEKNEYMQHVFRRMDQQWKDGSDPMMKPNETTFHALIYGMCQSGNPKALHEVERLLRGGTMQRTYDLQPTVKMYNSLMAAWMKLGKPHKVESVFKKLQEPHEQAGALSSSNKDVVFLKPSANAHTTRLQSWSKAGVPDRASQALREWIMAAQQTDDTNHQMNQQILPPEELPTTQAFNAVLHAWLRSNHPEAPARIANGLRQMYELSDSGKFQCRPDLFSYSTALSAHAKHARKDPNSGKSANKILQKMKRIAKGEPEKDDDPVEQQHPAMSPTYAMDNTLALRNTQPGTLTTNKTKIHGKKKSKAPKLIPNKEMEPDLFVYAHVIFALLRSAGTQLRTLAKDRDGNNPYIPSKPPGSWELQRAQMLLDELEAVDTKKFWQTKTTAKFMGQIHQELQNLPPPPVRTRSIHSPSSESTTCGTKEDYRHLWNAFHRAEDKARKVAKIPPMGAILHELQQQQEQRQQYHRQQKARSSQRKPHNRGRPHPHPQQQHRHSQRETPQRPERPTKVQHMND